jgi:hypothetical protein
MQALLARLVVREEDSPLGIEKCLAEYSSAAATCSAVLDSCKAVSVDGLADPDTIMAQAVYNLGITPAIPVPVPTPIDLPEEFAAEETDEAVRKRRFGAILCLR